MRVTLISDTHIDHRDDRDIPHDIFPEADILVAAGDIGDPHDVKYTMFLAAASEKYKHVILITGNHEYYNHDVVNTENYIRKIIEPFPNIHFLQKDKIVIDDIVFLGCTLWSI